MKKLLEFFLKNKLLIYISIILASIVTVAQFANKGDSLFLIVALFLFVIVVINRVQFEAAQYLPVLPEMLVGALLVAGSFGLAWIKDNYTEGFSGFGMTNYAVFLLGITIMFYGYSNLRLIAPPVILLIGMSAINWMFFTENASFLRAAETALSTPETSLTAWLLHFYDPNFHNIASGSGSPVNILFYSTGISDIRVYSVAGGCSGVEGTSLFFLLSFTILMVISLPLWQKAAILVIGTIGQFFMNILRLVTLGVIWDKGDFLGHDWQWWHLNDYFALGDLFLMTFMTLFWLGVFMVLRRAAKRKPIIDKTAAYYGFGRIKTPEKVSRFRRGKPNPASA